MYGNNITKKNSNKEYILANSHKNNAIAELNFLLSHYLNNKDLSKVHLLSYWFEDFAKYNLIETTSSKIYKEYKRGSLIKANLGFNIGNEENGNHYCIVIDKNNSSSSETLTVIPLTSTKNIQNSSNYTLDLGNEIYLNLSKLCGQMSRDLSAEYENVWKLSTEKMEQFKKDFEYTKKTQEEISEMKDGILALVRQITTISKQRIYVPSSSKDILSNLRVSDKILYLIDSKIKEYFLN